MQELKDLFPKDLYHSYIIEGDPSLLCQDISSLLEKRGDIEKNSADLRIALYDAFTIADSASIKEWHSELGRAGTKKVCIIGAKFINHDAERTLLKMIEEPHDNTHFFLVVPNADILLDTIKSRSHVLRLGGKESTDNIKNGREFLKENISSRLAIIEAMIKSHKDDDGSGALRHAAIELINNIEKVLYEAWKKDKADANIAQSMKELGKAREYLSLPGAAVKMILENIAINV